MAPQVPPDHTDVAPEGARWDDGLAEFILPYEVVRTAAEPETKLLTFLQSTYEAAAASGRWDRGALERRRGALHQG